MLINLTSYQKQLPIITTSRVLSLKKGNTSYDDEQPFMGYLSSFSVVTGNNGCIYKDFVLLSRHFK